MIEYEVMKTLRDIDLTDKANASAKHLSGGQKRKLSIGIAVIGDPKVLFLTFSSLRFHQLVLLSDYHLGRTDCRCRSIFKKTHVVCLAES